VVSNVDRVINDLEQQLLTPDITPAQVFAIKKNIAMHKAVKVKEQRQQGINTIAIFIIHIIIIIITTIKEMETRQRKRDEEDQKKREKLALEAAERDNNDTTSIPATNSGTNKNANIEFDDGYYDGRQSNHYDGRQPNHQLKQGLFSGQHQQHQQHDANLPPRFLRSNSEVLAHHQDVNYNDYQHQHQASGQHHRLQQQQQQQQHIPHDSLRSKTAPNFNFTRSDRSTYGGIGATSAPFGNAYNDDDDGTD